MLKKEIVLFIIFLFIGISIFPSINGIIKKKENLNKLDIFEAEIDTSKFFDGNYNLDTFLDKFKSNVCIERYSEANFNQDNLSFDVQIRETGGTWQNYNITAYNGSILEFKIIIKTTRGYQFIGAVISLPTTDKGPMFDYIENSEHCSKRTTIFEGSDAEAFFLWIPVLFPTTITCTFQAEIQNLGTEKEILGVGMGVIDNESFDFMNDSLFVTGKLSPIPNTPDRPDGPTSGIPDNEYTYTTRTTDPNGDQIYYMFDWGDGTDSGWLGPYDSGNTCEASKTWNSRGTYGVKAKAKDIDGHVSKWSNYLSVTMPKNKPFITSFIDLSMEHFPILYQIFERLYSV